MVSWITVIKIFFILLSFLTEINGNQKLGDFILYFEPVRFLTVTAEHSLKGEAYTNVEFFALQKRFKLRITYGTNLLAKDARLIIHRRNITSTIDAYKYASDFVEGSVVGDAASEVFGTFKGGYLDVLVNTHNETYYIEPSSRHFKKFRDFKLIIYRRSDINISAILCKNSSCKPERWGYIEGPRSDQVRSLPRKMSLTAMENELLRPDFSHLPTLEPKSTCKLSVIIDHFFFQKTGNRSMKTTTEYLLYYAYEVNGIFKNTPFTENSGVQAIFFQVKSLELFASENEVDYWLFDKNLDAQKYLEFLAEYDFDDFCLGVGLTAHTFKNQMLGLAFLANSLTDGNLGGICQERKYLVSHRQAMSYNALVVTTESEDMPLPRVITALTLAHEIGHAFGSLHDEPGRDCSVHQGKGGSFLMNAYTVTGREFNNWRFSTCSIIQMSQVMEKKAGKCFKKYRPECGNSIPEAFEECDCGGPLQCAQIDKCCTPQGGRGRDAECTYRRMEGKICSPMSDPCCTQGCNIVSKELHQLCTDPTGCRLDALCNGSSPYCPSSAPKPDNVPCKKYRGLCKEGICRTDVCSLISLVRCECEKPEFRCYICCTEMYEEHGCKPASEHGLRASDGFPLLRTIGDLCDDSNDYMMCDTDGKCLNPYAKGTGQFVEECKDCDGRWNLATITIIAILCFCAVLTICCFGVFFSPLSDVLFKR